MKFKEIANRITGISTAIFGISWTPPELERDIARRIITYLEDRRVLYNPSAMEVPEHCARSVVEIRQFLSVEIASLSEDSELSKIFRAMRAACRKFLDLVGSDENILRFGSNRGHYASWEFNGAVGELRGVFGIHLAQIAARYGLDIEDGLAFVLPAKDDSSPITAALFPPRDKHLRIQNKPKKEKAKSPRGDTR